MHTTVDFTTGIESFRDDELEGVLSERASDIVSLTVTGELVGVEMADHTDELCIQIDSLRVVFHAEPAPYDGSSEYGADAYYETEEEALFSRLGDLNETLRKRLGQRVKLALRGDGLVVTKPMEARLGVRAFTSVNKARAQ